MSIYVSNKTINKILALIIFSMSASLVSANTQKEVEKILKHKVITLKPEQLSSISGKAFDGLSLSAVKNSAMEPIPFQFDEFAENDYIYIPDTQTSIKGVEGIFDEQDELLFMYRDAGPRKKPSDVLDGELISEIEILLDNQKKYVYLVKDARLQADTDYVRYSSKIGRTETDYYALQVDKGNAYMWENFYYNSFDGSNPGRPLDTIKLFGSTNVIPLAGMKFELNNKHMIARVLAEKTGPIRATTTYKATLTYMKLPIFNTQLQIRHYENSIVYDAIFNIPTLRRKTLANALIRLSIDGSELSGAEAAFSYLPEQKLSVDGKENPIEKSISAVELSEDDRLWTWIGTDEKFSLMSIYKFEQLADSDKLKAKVYPWYEDSAKRTVKPEYFEGQSPNLGYSIALPTRGSMRLRSAHNMFPEKISLSPEKIANIIEQEYLVTIH